MWELKRGEVLDNIFGPNNYILEKLLCFIFAGKRWNTFDGMGDIFWWELGNQLSWVVRRSHWTTGRCQWSGTMLKALWNNLNKSANNATVIIISPIILIIILLFSLTDSHWSGTMVLCNSRQFQHQCQRLTHTQASHGSCSTVIRKEAF